MANLDQLAPELLIQILSSIHSPAGLFSLVAASPACLRTYSLYQRPILLQVIVNSLSPQLVREFLAIANLVRLRSSGNDDNSIDFLRPFVDQYFSTELFDGPPPNVDIVPVRQTYHAVNRLTKIYFTHALAPLMYLDTNQYPGEKPPKFIPLSAQEKDRIQRAFYRYELYSRLFPPSERTRDSPREAMAQFSLFLRHMTPWELEELACIHHFLVSMIGGFMDDLEDEILDAVVSCPGVRGASNCGRGPWPLSDLDRITAGPRRVVLPKSSSPPSPGWRKRKRSPSRTRTTPMYPSRYRPSDDIPQKGYVSFSSLDQYGLEMFGRDFRQNAKSRFIGNLASRGLGFILKLMDAPSPSHQRLLIQSVPLTGRTFLPEALEMRPMYVQASVRTVPPYALHENDGIDLRDGPTAEQQRIPTLLFANRGTNYVRIYNDPGEIKWDCLRSIGYLFWDKARWEGANAKRAMVMSWNFAQIASRSRPSQTRGRSWCGFLSRRPSVEERLRGVSVLVGEMMRIEQLFGRKGANGCGNG